MSAVGIARKLVGGQWRRLEPPPLAYYPNSSNLVYLIFSSRSRVGALTGASTGLSGLGAPLLRRRNPSTPQRLPNAFQLSNHRTTPDAKFSFHTSSTRYSSEVMSPAAVGSLANNAVGAPKQNAWVGYRGAAGFDLRSK